MSDQIRRDFERLSGEPAPEPLFGARRVFGSLLGILLVLGLTVSGFWVGMVVQINYVPLVEPGTAVICDAAPNVVAFTTPGYHFCPSGEWSSFRLHERLDFTSEVRLRDANLVQVRVDVVYALPADPAQLTSIYRAAHDQAAFNEGVVRGNAVRNLSLVFAQVDTSVLLPQENLVRIGEFVADRTRNDLQRNWNVVLESFWFKVRVQAPSQPENFQPQSYELTL